MPVIHETAKYSFATHRGGGASLTRKADNTSVFFQPGDAANQAIDEVEGVYSRLASHFFDSWAGEYKDAFDAHASHNAETR